LSNVLLNGLDSLAEPDTLNKLIINIIKSLNEEAIVKKTSTNIPKVQLLKHWCQMNGCIYKSIQTPTLKEIFENNELLNFFISYLSSANSISIPQLFFTLSNYSISIRDA